VTGPVDQRRSATVESERELRDHRQAQCVPLRSVESAQRRRSPAGEPTFDSVVHWRVIHGARLTPAYVSNLQPRASHSRIRDRPVHAMRDILVHPGEPIAPPRTAHAPARGCDRSGIARPIRRYCAGASPRSVRCRRPRRKCPRSALRYRAGCPGAGARRGLRHSPPARWCGSGD